MKPFSALCMMALAFSAGAGQLQMIVTADPDQVRFSKFEDTAIIHVMKGEEPLPSDTIKGARVLIGKSDYSDQFVIGKSTSGPATITISPKPETAQVGTFGLVISTKFGDALVAVDMPLDQIPGTLEDRAKKEGITVDELKAKLGLSQEGQRETLTVRLPQWQYIGSTFSLRMPTSPGRDFTWKMDGDVVLQGKNENTLKYVLQKTGEHRVDMEMREGDAMVAQWSGVLEVVNYPDMRWQVRKGQSFQLRAPKGFKSHQWKVDGHGAGNSEVLKHTFKETGEHTIECTSHDPIIGEPGEFRVQTWKTLVR